jgi:hypothetical protein
MLSKSPRLGRFTPTLASHDPEAITRFVREHGHENVIFKTFMPAGWKEEGGRQFGTPTSFVDANILSEPDDLRICPGIYQRYIPKDKEIRVTVMGDRAYCVEVIPTDGPDSSVDWRVGQERGLRVIPCKLPDAVEDKCRKVVSTLGLIFGCVDLILGKDGRWYFLEVNEMGQFLWIEHLCPSERYLEAFIQFLFRLCGHDLKPARVQIAEVENSLSYKELMATTFSRSTK